MGSEKEKKYGCGGHYAFGNEGSRRGSNTSSQCGVRGKEGLRCHYESGHEGDHCACVNWTPRVLG